MALTDFSQSSEDFRRIERAIQYIEANFRRQPSLDEIARHVRRSKYHFDRLFKRWAGISPMQFLQFVTLDYAKQCLAESSSLLETAFDAGLSGPGRLHDLFVTFEAMTPGEYKKKGGGLTIAYGFHHTPFGECLLATTARGICYLGFVAADGRDDVLAQLRQTWPASRFVADSAAGRPIVERIFGANPKGRVRPFNVVLKGTNFQVNVWRALLTVPKGWVVTYQDVAAQIGRPRAVRAAANAVAANPVSYLIPCHRVIAKSGRIHRYRWGSARKKALLGWEAAARHSTVAAVPKD